MHVAREPENGRCTCESLDGKLHDMLPKAEAWHFRQGAQKSQRHIYSPLQAPVGEAIKPQVLDSSFCHKLAAKWGIYKLPIRCSSLSITPIKRYSNIPYFL